MARAVLQAADRRQMFGPFLADGIEAGLGFQRRKVVALAKPVDPGQERLAKGGKIGRGSASGSAGEQKRQQGDGREQKRLAERGASHVREEKRKKTDRTRRLTARS